MDKNRITRHEGRTSEPLVTKSISTKVPECISGGCAPKADELTPGGLCRVPVLCARD